MRQTSIMAYNQINANGLLSKLRLEVYNTLFKNGPLTSGEITEIYLKKARVSISPRLAELKKMGVVREASQRPCGVTGTTCIAWEVTENLPIILSKKDKILQQISKLEEKILKLKNQLLEIE